jgi:hypothetical protein
LSGDEDSHGLKACALRSVRDRNRDFAWMSSKTENAEGANAAAIKLPFNEVELSIP